MAFSFDIHIDRKNRGAGGGRGNNNIHLNPIQASTLLSTTTASSDHEVNS